MFWRHSGDIVVRVLSPDDVVGAAALESHALEGQLDGALVGLETGS